MSAYPRVIDPTGGVNLRQVAENLYVGGVGSVDEPYQWDTVIEMVGFAKVVGRPYNPDYLRFRKVLSLPMEDGIPVPDFYLKRAAAAVAEAKGPVLVHCFAGISRSVSVAYGLLRLQGIGHHEAVRRVFSPNGHPPLDETFGSVVRWVKNQSPNGTGDATSSSFREPQLHTGIEGMLGTARTRTGR